MQRILIVGAGFAGMYAALSSARLRDEQGVSPDTLEIAVAAPEPRLVIRPRLYERAPETMVAPLAELFDAVDVRYERGQVDLIDRLVRFYDFDQINQAITDAQSGAVLKPVLRIA